MKGNHDKRNCGKRRTPSEAIHSGAARKRFRNPPRFCVLAKESLTFNLKDKMNLSNEELIDLAITRLYRARRCLPTEADPRTYLRLAEDAIVRALKQADTKKWRAQ